MSAGISSEPETVTISNTGSSDTTVALQLAGTDADQFELQTNEGSNTCATPSPTISANRSCSVTIRFNPQSAGSKTASVDITLADASVVSVVLTGTGLTAGNAAPTAPTLVFPANMQTDIDSTVKLRWEPSTDPDGDTVSYQVFYCSNQTFSGCTGVDVPSNSLAEGQLSVKALLIIMSLLMLALVSRVFLRRKRQLIIFFIALLVGASCGTNHSTQLGYSISGLSAGTTYYWKVIASDGNGEQTASEIWSFTVKQ